MTVSNTTVKLNYNGNGSNRTFALTFPLLSAAHLRIVVTDAAGTETEINNNFSLNTALDTLTYPTVASGLDPLPTGSTLTLIRQTPLTQEIDLHSGGALDAEQLETGYDKLTYLLQELKEQVARCIKYAVAKTDIHTAEQFLSDITTAAANAATSATSAATSATTASEKASQASTSQVLAAGYATDASNYASAASDSATSALSYKNAAASSAYDAGQAASAAESAKDDAEAAKDVVDGYKDDAAGYASEASVSASAAATSASAASDAKDLAVSAKTAAANSADIAASAASNAQSAAATCATVDTKISTHNDSNSAHADIRALIKTYTAGTNVTISDQNVISATDTKYTAGTNITISENNVISATGGGGGGSVDIDGSLDPDSPNPVANSALYTAFAAKQPKTLDTAITVAGESKTTVEAALGAINTMAAGKAAGTHTHTKSEITDFPNIPTVPTKLSDFTDDLGSSPTHTHSQYLTSVPVATTSTAGKVKVDGTTITAASDGTISAVGGSSASLSATYDSTNKILTLE